MHVKVKGFGDNIPIKLIATVLVAIMIPSILVTALGLATVFQADGFVKEFVLDRYRADLERAQQALGGEWERRLGELERRLEDGHERGAHLADLRDDPCVSDVLYSDGSGLHRLPVWTPARELFAPVDAPELAAAERLERVGDDEGALAAWESLVRRTGDDAILVEALVGAARVCDRLGNAQRAIQHLDHAIKLFGDTADESGVRRELPLLLARLRIVGRSSPTNTHDASVRLARALARERPRLSPEVVSWYVEQLGAELTPRGDPRRLLGWVEQPSLPPVTSSALNALRAPLGAAVARMRAGEGTIVHRADLTGHGRVTFLSSRIGSIDFYVHVLLDRDAFLDDLQLVLEELRFDPARFAVGRVGELPTDRSEDGVRDVAGLALPRPFDDFEVRWVPEPGSIPVGFHGFRVLTLWSFTWAVILLVLTIVVGVFYTLRYVLRETRTARLKSDFVGFISHELKTPLAAIRMFTETLLAGRVEDDAERQTCLELIDKESERLSKLIDTVLEYSRIERQQKTFRFASGSIEEVVNEAVRLFHGHTKDRPRKVEVNAVQQVSKIQMDRDSMVELMLNLLSNADKYSPAGEPIVINLRETVDDITVEVIDRGVGIPKRDQKRIFEKFFRSNDYLSRAVEGSGLGLAFARYIAKVHNGEIRVSSQVNSGSTFTLQLRKTHVLAE